MKGTLLWLFLITATCSVGYGQLFPGVLSPTIDGQAMDIETNQNTPVEIKFEHLSVTPGLFNLFYPNGFTLTVQNGSNYTVDGHFVVPRNNFDGRLTVPVSVNDGTYESNTFNLRVNVNEVENIEPVITAQAGPLTTQEATPITLTLADLLVTDPDNTYPTDFTLKVNSGRNYSRTGTTVTPSRGFTGVLSVGVTVNDGEDESDEFDVTIEVTGNQKPVITAQKPLTTQIRTPLTINLSDLEVTDDSPYPGTFTMTIYNGTGYTRSGNVVTPSGTRPTTLTVPVSVNDGALESDRFNLTVTVEAKPNEAPEILSQRGSLTTTAGTAITLGLQNLNVQDSDNDYPDDFTMTVAAGDNYTVSGLRVTPAAGFTGELRIPVTVNDGTVDSAPYTMTVNVTPAANVVPRITGQTPMSTQGSTPITIRLGNLTVSDSDNTYPDDFTLTVYAGTGYTFSGTTVTPNLLFFGNLSVRVSVNDGKDESAIFNLRISVELLPNSPPTITSAATLNTAVNTAVSIKFEDLKVDDADNPYPSGFKMTLYSGQNFTFSGQTVTPADGFEGQLSVPVSVNDGVTESNRFNVPIDVIKPPNVAPKITGQTQTAFEVEEDKPLTIAFSMLTVEDPDNTYPTGFKLNLLTPTANANYTVSGETITPAANYHGDLSVRISVNDGAAESNVWELKVKVTPVNDPPRITGLVKPLTTFFETPIALTLEDFVTVDPDGDKLTLKIGAGKTYTLSGNTLTPNANVTGDIDVTATVNDGTVTSAVFSFKIRVLNKPNIPPVITGQNPDPVIAVQNTELEIALKNLVIEDEDNPDKSNFVLSIKAGTNYTVKGNKITPANNYTGALTVPVTVSDGTDVSPVYNLKVSVIPPSARPIITGQNPVATDEDTPITLTLKDLLVTDTDDTYPIGFTMQILPGSGYVATGAMVTPTKDFNGFLLVSITVTDDGGNKSDPYALAILVRPVNDAPVIAQFETSDLTYQPGDEAIQLTQSFSITDVDNTHMSFAEISFASGNYKTGYDQLLFSSTSTIRGLFDADSGKLSLIGYAPIKEYEDAIRSIQYFYNLHETDGGYNEPLPVDRTIYFLVQDGQMYSEKVKRKIIMETDIKITIPTAFSPNEDDVNETWQIIPLSNPQQCENAIIKVFDKRGMLLFESKGIEKQWDGRLNGQLLPTGTYFYTVDLMLTYAKKTYKGAVTIIR